MGVDYKVSQLYDAAIRRIAGSQVEWKQILKLAGQLYRYEFDNILMVYMQRPKATLVADFGTWKKVGRYVRKGSRGIAIFPSRALRAGMRHVFDISDTGGRQQELTWRLHAGNREAYAAYLYQESGIKKTEEQKNQEAENEESRHALQTIASFLEKRIKLLVETEFADRVAEFRKLAESRQQPHLTEQEQTGIVVEALLRNSIYYVVGTRCGLEISPENQDFSALSAFSSEEEIYCLGSLVSDVSCMV